MWDTAAVTGGDGTILDLFRGMRARRNSTETQQSGHTQGLDQRPKIEGVVLKMARQRLRCGTIQKEVS